ncbi:MAG TPA: ATP-binding protein [Bacteroidales bacterium]|nr:ATP-binding protein [Bacteroidales bacterium]
MVYKNFYVRIVLQVILLVVTVLSLAWALQKPHLWVTSVNLSIIVVIEVFYLIWFINRINRDLAKFFEAFRFQDTMLTFDQKKENKAFWPLYQGFDRIMQEFRRLRAEQDKDRFFYLNALNHIGIGLIVLDGSGNVRFSNNAIHKMLGVSDIVRLDVFNRFHAGFSELLLRLTPNRKELVRVVALGEMVQLSLRSTEFRMEGELFRIISLQDIRYEIEQREVEAWQKLIRILTHEIMNSVSPITLTSSGIINMLESEGKPKDVNQLDETTIDNTLMGLHAIRKRSKGLANFVENYRSITKLPQPTYSTFSISSLIEQLERLFNDEFANNHIRFTKLIVPADLQLNADEKLIEQVLINLFQNAIQALADIPEKQLKITAKYSNEYTTISVADNGKGIPPDIIETIFVPFFTTKQHGNGIGLTLSREIMKLHGGYIKVTSTLGQETVFTLSF